MLKTLMCIGFLLIEVQISSAKTSRYTQSNIELWLTYRKAEDCIADSVSNINFDIGLAIEDMKENCEDALKKSDDFQSVIDSLDQLRDYSFDQRNKMIELIQSCNDTHCPEDVKEQGKKISDDLRNAVRKAYDDGAASLDNILPGTKCAPYLKCIEKRALCFYVYEFYDICFEDINPVFQSKDPFGKKFSKSLKLTHSSTKLSKKARQDNIVEKKFGNRNRDATKRGTRIGFKNVKPDYSNTKRLKGMDIKISKLRDLGFRDAEDVPSDPNEEGCDQVDLNWRSCAKKNIWKNDVEIIYD